MGCSLNLMEFQSLGKHMEALENDHLTPEAKSERAIGSKYENRCTVCLRFQGQSRFSSSIIYPSQKIPQKSEDAKCLTVPYFTSSDRISTISANSASIVSKRWHLKTIVKSWLSSVKKNMRSILARLCM